MLDPYQDQMVAHRKRQKHEAEDEPDGGGQLFLPLLEGVLQEVGMGQAHATSWTMRATWLGGSAPLARSRGAGFAEESLPELRHGGQRGGKQFDGYRPIQGHIAGKEHVAHPPASQFAGQRVAAGDRSLEGEELR